MLICKNNFMRLTEEEKIKRMKEIIGDLEDLSRELNSLKKEGRGLFKEVREFLDKEKRKKLLNKIGE